MTPTRRAEWLQAYWNSPVDWSNEEDDIPKLSVYAAAWADAALAAADERFPPPPWPETGSSLPEGVGEELSNIGLSADEYKWLARIAKPLIEERREIAKEARLSVMTTEF